VDRWLFPLTDGKNWRDIVAEGCVQYGGALSAFNPYGVETVFHKSTKWSVSFRKALSRHFSTKQMSSTAVTNNTSSTPSACPFLRVIGVSRGSAPATEEDAVPVDDSVSVKQKSTKQT